jgi:hypothetical protein
MIKAFLAICFILVAPVLSLAQDKDSLIVKDTAGTVVAPKPVEKAQPAADTAAKRTFSPRKAALYSAIFPGLGQIYNKKYWKVPIVYTAVGIPVYLFFDNKRWYNRTRYALAVVSSGTTDPDSLNNVHDQLKNLVANKRQDALLNYRNEFRKDMDYSIIFTLLFWGLNIIDATVDAHLKGFNVSDNLSMKIKPTILSTQSVGISLVLNFTD